MVSKQRVTVGVHTIDVLRWSNPGRPTVVLIHGLGVSSAYFRPFARELSKQYDVIAIDLPGYGKTPKPPRPLTITQLSDVATQFIRQQGIERPVLVGQSMGCQIVAHVVRDTPDLCARYILLGPTVHDKERTFWQQAARLLRDCLHEPIRLNALIVRDYFRMGPLRYLRTSRYMLDDHIEDTLQGSSVPGLILRGEKDSIAPRDWISRLTDVASGSEAGEVAGGAHVVQYTQPRKVAEICHAFIDKRRGGE